MEENLREGREKYLRVKAEVTTLLEQDKEYGDKDLANLQKAISSAEQDCLARGIGKDTPLFNYEKSAAALYVFKHRFSKSNDQRGKYVQWILISSGYDFEEKETIKGLISEKEGKLEQKAEDTSK